MYNWADQGESNCVKCDTSIYVDKTLALVNGWREVFDQPDLPFYFVQLAPFKYTQAFGPSWEEQGFEIRTVCTLGCIPAHAGLSLAYDDGVNGVRDCTGMVARVARGTAGLP